MNAHYASQISAQSLIFNVIRVFVLVPSTRNFLPQIDSQRCRRGCCVPRAVLRLGPLTLLS